MSFDFLFIDNWFLPIRVIDCCAKTNTTLQTFSLYDIFCRNWRVYRHFPGPFNQNLKHFFALITRVFPLTSHVDIGLRNCQVIFAKPTTCNCWRDNRVQVIWFGLQTNTLTRIIDAFVDAHSVLVERKKQSTEQLISQSQIVSVQSLNDIIKAQKSLN